jgi:voltage-gated potassium channel
MKFLRPPAGLNSLYYAAILLVMVIAGGVIGYRIIEGFSLLDSFYMVVITVATVGFKEVRALDDAGKIFTILLILFSFGIFAYAVTTITRFIIDGGFRNYYLTKKINRMIEHTQNHVIVCGYGRNGSQACRELKQHNQPFIVVESRDSVINRIREDGIKIFIQGDATQDSILEQAGVRKAKALITTMPSDADNTFVVLTARHLNPDLTIISRASGHYSDAKLKRAGANNVIMPDRLGGTHMAKLVIQPDVIEFIDNILLQSGKTVRLEELPGTEINARYLDRTIGDLAIRTGSGATIIGIKTHSGDYIYNPSPNEKISLNDKLFVIGTPEQIDRLRTVVKSGNPT